MGTSQKLEVDIDDIIARLLATKRDQLLVKATRLVCQWKPMNLNMFWPKVDKFFGSANFIKIITTSEDCW